ncbi:MAG: sulfite exporter TauE/SafE family protein [Actinomycetota bacterium]
MGVDLLLTAAVLVAIWVSFTVSASAGLGGSLVLVPSLALVMGTKEGVALAALLLGANNVLKVLAYRRTLPFRAAALVVALLSLGAFLGASLLVRAPEAVVGVAVLVAFALTLVAEQRGWLRVRRFGAPALAFGAGATSGFSGTSGPLKGAAIRNLSLDKLHFVGAASLASLFGDLTKTAVFAEAQLLDGDELRLAAASVPLMIVGTLTGRRLNHRLGETGFAILFWTVMAGYALRVTLTLL